MMRVDFDFVCPECRGALETDEDGSLRCPADGHVYPVRDGIPRLLTDERFDRYRRFLADYAAIRRDEGRDIPDAAAYRLLPRDAGPHRAEWRVRARSFAALVDGVVEPMAETTPTLTIADLGAGSSWMTRRFALAGHRAVAVDINTDPGDGLACRRFAEVEFDAVQAEFDRLPFPDGACDLVVFNGSLHYTTDPAVTVAEALRVLRPDGELAILDTPLYRSASAGREMVAERAAAFEKRYGAASDSVDCRGFLTFSDLETLGRELDLEWLVHRPRYGLAWTLRPLWSMLRRRREPATFALVWTRQGRWR